MEAGEQIGEWVVEEALDGTGRYRCHRVDSPFRKAVLTAFRGVDRAAAAQQAGQLARLQHPNIGGVLGSTTSGDELYVVTELVQGSSLRLFLRGGEAGRIPVRTVATVAFEIADALAAAHERRFFHGDVRPESILLGVDGKARLVGFERMGTSDDLGQASRYVAPEVVAPGGSPTAAADAFAFGVVLFELASGGRLTEADPRRSSLDETVPRAIRDLVASLTHPDPVARPTLQKARQVLQQLLLDLSDTSLDDTFRSSSEPAEAPLPSRVGRYDVVRELGRGGVGVVYEGVDPVLQRRVALKLLIAGSWARPREVQRFKLEAQAVARLDHPGIVKILDIGGDLDGAWFAMEFVAGPSLADALVRAGGRLPWREGVAVAAQVARALQHAHEHGLLHRDVKPNNVLLDGDRAKLADFGLAFDAASDHTRLTGTGQVLGTPTYMAPEQAAGELDRLGPHTDVYGLGVLLYEAVTGRVPFEGASPLQVIANILAGDAPPPRRHVPDLPRELDTITSKALRLDPKDRYANAAAFAEDLERLLAGDAILAADPTVVERIRHSAGKHRRTLVAGAVAASLAVAGFAAVALGAQEWRSTRTEHDAMEALDGVRKRITAAESTGDAAEADAAFRTFVERPEHAGTRALVLAWTDRAAALHARGEAEEELSALSSAYLAARRPADVDATVEAMALAAHGSGEHALVVALGDLAVQRYPRVADRIRPLVRDALVARRQVQIAADLVPGDAVARAAATWTTARRTEWREPLVVTDPGHRAALLQSEDHLYATDGALSPVGPGLPFHGGALLAGWGERGIVVAHAVSPTASALVDWGAGTLSPGPALPMDDVQALAAADLDGDGVDELWGGVWRRLYRFDRRGAGWSATPAHAETNESNSRIADLLASDVDGDGQPDLVVAAGEWGAYDVRWFSWDPAAHGLKLRGRERLGVVQDLAPTHAADGSPRVLACKTHEFPNLRVFPEEAPWGAADGLYELSFAADGRIEARHLDARECRRVYAGDVDGDGLEDFVATDDQRTLVGLRGPDDTFSLVFLDRADAHGLLQADADPQAEILLWDHEDQDRAWVLGDATASGSLPPLRSPLVPPASPPSAGFAFVEAWRRAEDLVALGRLSDAQQAFRDLARLGWGSADGEAALLRSADLAFARGAFAEAAEVYLEADALGSDGALSAAIRSRRAGRDEPGELELLLKARDRGTLDDEASGRLALLLPSSLPPVELRFDQPLDPRWEVGEALWATHSPGRGELAIEVDGPGTVLRLPVTRPGRWAAIELDGTIDRSEWGAVLEFTLEPRGSHDRTLSFELAGKGGGEIVERMALCVSPDPVVAGGLLPGGPGVPLHGGVVGQADGTLRCHAAGGLTWDGDNRPRNPREWPAGTAWDFVIRSASNDTSSLAVRLRAIRLLGVAIDPDAPPTSASARGLVEGRAPVGAGPWEALVAGAHRQDVGAVVEALRVLPADDPRTRRALGWLLHARLDSWGSALRPAVGEAWPATLADVWTSPLLSEGRRDPALRDMLLRWTDGAEEADPEAPAQRASLQLLLLGKGASALQARQWDLARAALARAVDLGLPDPTGSPEDVRWTRTAVAVGLVDLAEIAVRDGDPDQAFALLDRAFGTTPIPLVLGDVVGVRPGLASLRGDPRWRWTE